MARPNLHGAGRISAALLAAPSAALAATFGIAALPWAADDVRYAWAVFLAFPAMAAASCWALLARNGARAWVVSGGVLLAGAILFCLSAVCS